MIWNKSAISHICFIKDLDTESSTSPQTNAWFGKAELCYAWFHPNISAGAYISSGSCHKPCVALSYFGAKSLVPCGCGYWGVLFLEFYIRTRLPKEGIFFISVVHELTTALQMFIIHYLCQKTRTCECFDSTVIFKLYLEWKVGKSKYHAYFYVPVPSQVYLEPYQTINFLNVLLNSPKMHVSKVLLK